jgi:hypothetical protein
MVDHLFGGPWTEIKLDAIQYYLECYAKALTPKKFDLWYIDAFAGTGDRIETRKVGGLLEGVPESTVTETLAGSARRALQVTPPFQHFIFNEMHAARRAALQKILTENPDRDIEILDTDANAALRQIFGRSSWAFKDQGKARGIVFLNGSNETNLIAAGTLRMSSRRDSTRPSSTLVPSQTFGRTSNFERESTSAIRSGRFVRI